MRVKVVTDSTSDLPPEVAARFDIVVVPAQIQFGEDGYRDGVDLTTDDFYHKLRTSPVLPKTSPPSVGALKNVYRRLAEEADCIVSIHVSAHLSATYDAARIASSD